jgi:hypothetical protein
MHTVRLVVAAFKEMRVSTPHRHVRRSELVQLDSIVRPLGAFERLYFRYMESGPMHFSLGAEFATVLSATQIRSALQQVQRRHPLLSVHVDGRAGSQLVFARGAAVPPIPLQVVQRDTLTWPELAGQELRRPMDTGTAPLMRALLVTDAASSVVLLTFDHTIADGMSAFYVLKDLVMALNGHRLARLPIPPSQEDLIDRLLPPIETAAPGDPLARHPSIVPSALRPFDGSLPHVSTITFDLALTRRLVERCRVEQTTVHSVIVAAASRARSELHGEEFVRVTSPLNIRPHIGGLGECVPYTLVARTGSTPLNGDHLWDQARAVGSQLAMARSAAGVSAASIALRQLVPDEIDSTSAVDLLMNSLGYDLLLTNLGALDIERSGPIQPTAVWGPLLLCQVEGEQITGIATFGGRARMVVCSYTPNEDFLPAVRRHLTSVLH